MKKEQKKYQIIYADPPWSYQNGGVPQGGVDKEYPTMKIEDIKKLPINELADDTCVLMMWATFPQLQEALDRDGKFVDFEDIISIIKEE